MLATSQKMVVSYVLHVIPYGHLNELPKPLNDEVSPMAQETDLPQGTTDDMVDMLVDDMLQKAHTRGENPKIDAKVEAAVAERNGMFFPRRQVQGTALLGFPGHGKTSAFKAAAKEVAKLLDLKLKINPANNEKITRNDFVLISRELSGEVHNGAIVGLPGVDIFETEDGEEEKFMTQYSNKRLASLRHAGVSALLLDDALNASPNIQNICLSLAEEGRYDSLNLGDNTYVGLTGNLGSLDGTYTTKMSSALRTRLKLFQVEDTVENWTARTQKEFDRDVADGGLSGFLENNPDMFHNPKPKGSAAYPTPRTWSKLAAETEESAFYISKGASSDRVLNHVTQVARGTVGQEAATRLRAYLHSLYTMASPLAREAVNNKGELSEKSLAMFNEKLGSGLSQEGQEFGHQYVMAVAEIGAHKVAKAYAGGDSEAVRLAYADVSHALLDYESLQNDLVSRGFGHLLVRLNSHSDEIVANTTGRPTMNSEHLNMLGEEAANCDRSAWEMEDGSTFFKSVLVPQLSGKLFTDNDLMSTVNVDLDEDDEMSQ